MTEADSRPLFETFPALRGQVPFVPLANLPTPLERMERLSAEAGAEIWIRFPVIPGVTDDRGNVEALGAFVASLGHTRVVHLLPFHRTASDKYARLDRRWSHDDLSPSPPDALERITEALRGHGLEVRTGG